MKGNSSYNSANNGASLSFSNGGGPGGKSWPCAADWLAGCDTPGLLWHCLVLT